MKQIVTKNKKISSHILPKYLWYFYNFVWHIFNASYQRQNTQIRSKTTIQHWALFQDNVVKCSILKIRTIHVMSNALNIEIEAMDDNSCKWLF